jgi:CRISPR-associated protein Csx17
VAAGPAAAPGGGAAPPAAVTELALLGCTRAPLGDYLKALGVLRVVAEQADPEARAWWEGGVLRLRARLDRAGLLALLAERYAPAPIVAPWNSGSGFYPKDAQDGIAAIAASTAARLAPYRAAIAACRAIVERAGLRRPPEDEAKAALIEAVRAAVDDDALAWVDAAVALTEGGPAFPPLLGTGGNDGRLDFSNNQMQRLAELLIDADGAPALLASALFGDPVPRLTHASIGQFRPSAAGGANAGPGFARDALTNPWDYVLALEGALLFAAALTRRLEATGPGGMSLPFTVRATAAGYGSAAGADEADARAEMWLPLWSRPASLSELRAIFAEGRVLVAGDGADGRGAGAVAPRAAQTGVDFARAIATLGVDRGIDAFARVGFLMRNGRSYFATPLGAWSVARVPAAGRLAPLDAWLARLRRAASARAAPASLRRAASRVDAAVLALCRGGGPGAVADLLIALGAIEAVCARSPGARAEVAPVPPLSPGWLADAAEGAGGSPELRLAASLAASGIRRYLSPARPRGAGWHWPAAVDRDVVWSEGALVASLVAIARRREARGLRVALGADASAGTAPAAPLAPLAPPRPPARPAHLADVAAFLAGEVDDDRLAALVWALAPLDPGAPWPRLAPPPPRAVPAAFAVCRLALTAEPAPGVAIPHPPGVLARLASGDAIAATAIAARRLRGAGLPPRCDRAAAGGPHGSPAAAAGARRAAAALVFPLAAASIDQLCDQLICTSGLEPTPHDADPPT